MTRVRFAPSPTGYIHVGNARTALFNWMYARKTGGAFILRIEDTDRERSSATYEDALMEDLRWLGIDWDEGPDVGGAHGPYRQSERLDTYDALIQKLVDQGLAYPCYCTNEDLEARRKAATAQGEVFRYDNRCRELTDIKRRELESQGIRPAMRFKVPEKEVVVEDMVRGTCRFDSRLIGDFVIRKTDGMPTYHFGVVVDERTHEYHARDPRRRPSAQHPAACAPLRGAQSARSHVRPHVAYDRAKTAANWPNARATSRSARTAKPGTFPRR